MEVHNVLCFYDINNYNAFIEKNIFFLFVETLILWAVNLFRSHKNSTSMQWIEGHKKVAGYEEVEGHKRLQGIKRLKVIKRLKGIRTRKA